MIGRVTRYIVVTDGGFWTFTAMADVNAFCNDLPSGQRMTMQVVREQA